jgi:hypothetical protein
MNDKSEAREIRRTIVATSIIRIHPPVARFLLLCEFPAVWALDPTARVQNGLVDLLPPQVMPVTDAS